MTATERAQAWRNEKWSEYHRAGMELRDAEERLALAKHADKVAA
jgi:hypothetical protein